MTRIVTEPLLQHSAQFTSIAAASLGRLGLSDVPFLSPQWVLAYASAVSDERPVMLTSITTADGSTCMPYINYPATVVMAPARWTDYVDIYSTCEDPRAVSHHLRALLPTSGRFVTRELHPRGALSHALTALPTGASTVRLQMTRHYTRRLAAGVNGDIGSLVGQHTWRKKQRRLERKGYRLARYTGDAIDERRIDGFAKLHASRWRAAGYTSLFTDIPFRMFLRRLLLACPSLVLYTLEDADGGCVAYRLGMSTRTTYYDWLTTFAVQSSSESVGLHLLALVIEAERSRDTQQINFLRGSEKYKAILSDDVMLVPQVEVVA